MLRDFLDMEGVTGSIPVAPTIKTLKSLNGFRERRLANTQSRRNTTKTPAAATGRTRGLCSPHVPIGAGC